MVRPEYSGERDLTYSKWHRTLSNKCCATNVDFIEARYKNSQLVIVAILEEKDYRGGLRGFQKDIIVRIANALNVPAYLVRHNAKEFPQDTTKWIFDITNLITHETYKLNEISYRNFIENLGNI